MTLIEGDRVWWWHTPQHMRRGTVRALDTNDSIGVQPDDAKPGLLYLKANQLNHIDVGAAS